MEKFTGVYYYWTCPLRIRAEARNGYGANTMAHERTLQSTCLHRFSSHRKVNDREARGKMLIYVPTTLLRNAFN